MREESRKATKVCVFPLLCGSGGLEGQLTKVAGAEICGKSSSKSCINICRANPWDALAKKTRRRLARERKRRFQAALSMVVVKNSR